MGHSDKPRPKEKQSREDENREDESPTGIPHQKSTLPASPSSAIH
jgi:hypothetical protein